MSVINVEVAIFQSQHLFYVVRLRGKVQYYSYCILLIQNKLRNIWIYLNKQLRQKRNRLKRNADTKRKVEKGGV